MTAVSNINNARHHKEEAAGQKKVKPKALYPALYTAKIENPKLLKQVDAILKAWEKIAHEKHTQAEKSTKLSSKKKLRAEASSDTISCLRTCLKKGHSVYVAYDDNRKVQAIATKYFKPLYGKKDVGLTAIATHPHNIALFGTEKPIRGAGTSLVKHIVHEIKAKKHEGALHLIAENSALPFYKKLGFVCKPSIGSTLLHKCQLTPTKQDALLKAHHATGSIQDKEPKKLLLG